MPSGAERKKIDDLMESASEALAKTNYFEAERLASGALAMAWQDGDYERMARIIMPLQESRRQRVQQAFDAGFVAVMDGDPISEETVVEPGYYLVRPPRVGADARRLRVAGLNQEVPILVVCREPTTAIRLCPIVSTLPGTSYRTKIDLPEDPDQPDLSWFAGAIEMLGDTAIEDMDPARPVDKRIEYLMECLNAIPEHEGLHHALEVTCREAARAQAAESSSSAVT